MAQLPPVIGTPGGSLAGAGRTFALSDEVAEIGRSGEVRTARVLNGVARVGGPTVLHDLDIRWQKYHFNVDHVVVSGRKVWILDTKVWKAGVYWTLSGHTRRGFSLVPHTDKKTMEMAVNYLRGYLRNTGVQCQIQKPIIIIWPGSDGAKCGVRFYRPVSATAISAARFATIAPRMFGRAPADEAIVSRLACLVSSAQSHTGRATGSYRSDDF